MTASLARFLPDFEASRIDALHASRHHDAASGSSPEPKLDIESVRAQARAEGEAIARAELVALAARSIPEAVAARAAQIAELIAGDVEAVLAPLIDEAIRARILFALADEIRTVLELDNAASICVSGPDDVIQALRDILGPEAGRLVVGAADGVDIEVDFDRTRFVSRISDWAESLSGNLK